MYRLSFTIDTPGFPGDVSNVRTVQSAYALQQAVWEAAGKNDADVQHDDVEWVGGTDEGPWTFSDEELIESLKSHIQTPAAGDELDNEVDVGRWLGNEAEDDEQAARVYAEWRRREEGEAAAMAFEKMGEQYAGEPVEPEVDNRKRINRAIDLVIAIHSSVYDPNDRTPAEPKLAELERLLREIRL